jgi:hypothetical protein
MKRISKKLRKQLKRKVMLSEVIQQLVAALLGDLGLGQVADLSFDIPAQPKDISKIKSLKDASIPRPDPRKGCAIGWEASNQLSVRPPHSGIILADSNTVPLEISDLGSHIYGGPGVFTANLHPLGETYISKDKIGHIYTKYGGIIDIAHLRDHSDLARYIATKVVSLFKPGGEFNLGDDTDPARDDTGNRVVIIKPQGRDPSAYQAAVLGAFISYEVAVWHEITTYKTMQDYSTFSPEDNYSNLLGTYIGFKACLNELQSYDDAVTGLLNRLLMNMLAQPKNITFAVVEYLKDKWYKYPDHINLEPFKPRHKSPLFFPDIYLQVLRRHCQTGLNENLIDNRPPSFFVTPWLITDADRILTTEIRAALVSDPPSVRKISINIPRVDENNVDLRNYFTFEIRNAANKDDTLLADHLVNGTLDSTKFGQIADRLIDKYRFEFGPFVDDPSMAH